ncbi:hypothetical protein J6590_004531 [Homalodisca vitripennis]|nr:hypothetical protein J6590_004531 [Homalodisca vitripennis]
MSRDRRTLHTATDVCQILGQCFCSVSLVEAGLRMREATDVDRCFEKIALGAIPQIRLSTSVVSVRFCELEGTEGATVTCTDRHLPQITSQIVIHFRR